MKNQLSKRILLSLLVAIFGFGLSYADDPDSTTIIITPIVKDKPLRPFAPSYLKLSAYAVDGGVVVSSNVDVMAEVKIFDAESGLSYYNATVALAPDCRCPLPHVDAELTLQVIIDDKTYQGTIKR